MFRTAAAFVMLAAAAQATWKEVGTESFLATSMQFVSPTHGYLPAGQNGANGVQLFETTDAGKTWNATATVDEGLPLALCIAVNPPAVLVGGLFDQYFSADGKTFKKTVGAEAQAQDCRYQDGKYFVIGSGIIWGKGVAVSTDGAIFKGINITTLNPDDIPRYGAFPSEKAWYVVSGTFPESDDDNAAQEHGGFHGQISKSTDAGASWTTEFSTNDFYFNYVDCESETLCCASAESDGGAAPGSRILCTFDGSNWNQTYYDDSAQVSLMTMQSLGNGHFVAGGTYPSSNGQDIYTTFFRSADGGKTWTEDELSTLPQAAVIASSFPSLDSGFAMGIDRFQSEILFSYSA